MGESASGKDAIMNRLVEKFCLHKAISYTTRPIRENEKDGRDYYFLKSNHYFNDMLNCGDLFEKTEYNTVNGLWLYGLGKDSFTDKCTNVVVVNPHGYRQLLQHEELKDRLIPFYITADFETRFFRYLNRDKVTIENKVELVDRFIRDHNDFKNICDEFENIKTFYNNDETNIEDIVDHIEWLVYKSYV